MQPFMNDDFLLETATARTLYHDYAAKMPIIDYHCHINPREIYEDRRYENLTQAWLEGDHYKWRALRANGVDEQFITGSADDSEKFQKFAELLPKAIGNPLYHWAHLELKRYLGIDAPLSGKTADEIWAKASRSLSNGNLSVRGIIKASNVKLIGTTDDPADSLNCHAAIKNDPTFDVEVVPTFRPDKAVNIDKPGFSEYMKVLGKAADIHIETLADLQAALIKRLDFFAQMGCRASDHGMDYVAYREDTENRTEEIFKTVLAGGAICREDAEIYKTALMVFLGRELNKRGMVMQIHFNVVRNSNSRRFEELGADTGFDCISTVECGGALIKLLNVLDRTGELPKTILYSLNPADNAPLNSIAGCFNGTGAAGKIQHGSAWWFNDTKEGMEQQIKTLASISLLGNFIGMLTDSRSFLSYTRHEYFRRILCNILGKWAENGEYPNDIETLGQMVQDISYYNAKLYFELRDFRAVF